MTTFFQPSPSDPFSPGKVFTFLFLMLGPLKVIGPFVAMTAGWDGSLKRRLAFRAIAIAAVGLLAAVTLGATLLENWGVSLGAILLTAGIVLFLVALQLVMQQYAPHHQGAKDADQSASPATAASPAALAFAPLAFPTIVTPYGVALLILMVTMRAGRPAIILEIVGLAALVLALDLVAMLTADRILTTRFVRPALVILGSVLSVLQVALGVQIIIESIRLLRLTGPVGS